MLQNTVANKRSYALKSYADYKAQIWESIVRLLLRLKEWSLGKTNWNFNAYNALAIYGTAVELEWIV
jgi:UDP-N-acetylmuramoyl-L-alanyl-D-glutamate--2,6-diaminopimelate ligase